MKKWLFKICSKIILPFFGVGKFDGAYSSWDRFFCWKKSTLYSVSGSGLSTSLSANKIPFWLPPSRFRHILWFSPLCEYAAFILNVNFYLFCFLTFDTYLHYYYYFFNCLITACFSFCVVTNNNHMIFLVKTLRSMATYPKSNIENAIFYFNFNFYFLLPAALFIFLIFYIVNFINTVSIFILCIPYSLFFSMCT